MADRKPRQRRDANVKHPSGLTIRGADMKRARSFEWVWDQRILVGYLNLVMGEEGIGKGNLVAWIAARMTRGELPGDLNGKPSLALFVGDEDSWDGIWTPRLGAAGADLSLCWHIVEGTAGTFDLTRADDLTALREYVLDNDVRLVFFDQLLDNIGAADSWKDKQVREALNPLKDLAQKTNCAMLMSLHPNKRTGSFRNRVSGTPAFNALSRSSMLVARHPHDDDRVVMVRGKGNYSEEPPAFEFYIQQFSVNGAGGKAVTTSRIVDERDSYEVRASDVLDAQPSRRREDSDVGKARKLVGELLADREPHPAATIMERLRADGYSETTIQRASSALHVQKKKAGFSGGWTWRLP